MAKEMKTKPETIDDYMAGFEKETKQALKVMRTTIRKAAPKAEEVIKYGIPTYVLHGNLLSFGAWKTHIGFYPAPRGVESFKNALAAYDGNKSTIQFPLDSPLPVGLITKMVKYLVKRSEEKVKLKSKKK